jgi:hypothetical protein
VRPSVYDLRAFNLPPYLVAVAAVALLATATLVSAATDTVLLGPGNRVIAWVLGSLLGFLAMAGLAALPLLRRPRRLVIDHEGIRIQRGPRSYEFRLAWTELAGVGLVVDDRKRRRGIPLSDLPRSLIPVTVALELVPVDDAVRRRHPELATAWRLGRQRAWRVGVTIGPGEPLPIGTALQRWCPQPLWRGERSGRAFDLSSRGSG